MTDTPRCDSCAAGKKTSVATHQVSTFGVRPDHEPELACLFHALPGDLPLAGAVDAVRRDRFPEVGQPQGMSDE